MLPTLLYVLTPLLYLFLCIAVGFALRKTNILSENAGTTLAKLENWVFCPALSFMTTATYFNLDNLAIHGANILFCCIISCFAVVIAIVLSRLFVKKNCYERGVYTYALMFGNFGFLGDPLVIAIFGEEFFAYYKLFTLPLCILCYVWGISLLVPNEYFDKGIVGTLKRIFTPPTIALLLGMVVGLTDSLSVFPEFTVTSLNALKDCMGPVAMILAGITIAGFSVKKMLIDKKIYLITFLRLIIIPAIVLAFAYGAVALLKAAFSLEINNNVLFLTFFAFATPLGMNTIVFPQAYGGDAKIGASMAMISHTLCVISIPIMYALLTLIVGEPIV